MGESFVNIENVVVSASLNRDLNLNLIAQAFQIAYRRANFPGLVYRLKKPKTVFLIFSSGKMICIGAKSERQARRAVIQIVEDLTQKGIAVMGKPGIQIQNVVASGSLGGTVDLEKLVYSLKGTIYEPEQFPGLIYRMEDPKVVVLIFTSGRIVITGAKKEADAHLASAALKRTLEKRGLIYYD